MPKQLQELRIKAALRRDNEIVIGRQQHSTVLCPVECDDVIENGLDCLLESARIHNAHRHVSEHLTTPPKVPLAALSPLSAVFVSALPSFAVWIVGQLRKALN